MTTEIDPATGIDHALTSDRRSTAKMVAHKSMRGGLDDIWVWDDGWVTKRMGKRNRRIAWQPDHGWEYFVKNNRLAPPTSDATTRLGPDK